MACANGVRRTREVVAGAGCWLHSHIDETAVRHLVIAPSLFLLSICSSTSKSIGHIMVEVTDVQSVPQNEVQCRTLHHTFKHFWKSDAQQTQTIQLDVFLHTAQAPGAKPGAPPASAVVQLVAWDSLRCASQDFFFSYKR